MEHTHFSCRVSWSSASRALHASLDERSPFAFCSGSRRCDETLPSQVKACVFDNSDEPATHMKGNSQALKGPPILRLSERINLRELPPHPAESSSQSSEHVKAVIDRFVHFLGFCFFPAAGEVVDLLSQANVPSRSTSRARALACQLSLRGGAVAASPEPCGRPLSNCGGNSMIRSRMFDWMRKANRKTFQAACHQHCNASEIAVYTYCSFKV